MVTRPPTACALPVALALALAGCGFSHGGGAGKPLPPRGTIHLSSPALRQGAAIPPRFTCDGAGTSPPLRWSGLPSGTRSLALVVADPDAPGGTFYHWAVYGLPPRPPAIAEGARPPAREGRNSRDRIGWTPPCPPGGDSPHRYVFTLHAERRPLALPPGAAAADVEAAARRDALASGTLTVRYGR